MDQFWENSVKGRIREWTELMCACGTVILKPNGTGVDLVTPDRFEIISLDGNHYITGIVFQDTHEDGDDHFTKLEYHRFFTASVRMPDSEEYYDTTYYSISNRAFVSKNASEIGKPIDLSMTI